MTDDATPVAGLSRRGIATVASNIVGVPVALATSILISRLLGPAGKGSVDIAFTYMSLLTLGVSFSLVAGITYEVAQRRLVPKETIPGLLVIASGQGLAAALITYALSVLPLTSAFLPADIPRLPFIVAVGVSVGCVVGWGYVRGTFVGRQRIQIVNVTDLVHRFLSPIGITAAAVITLLFHRPLEPIDVIAVAVPAQALVLVILVAAERPRRRISAVPRAVLGRVARFALPTWAWDLLLYATLRFDLLLVGAFIGSAAVGVYAVSAALAQLMWLLPNGLAMVLLPHVASDVSGTGGTAATSAMLSRAALASSVLAAILVGGAAPFVVPFVYGPDFAGATVPLWLLLPGAVAIAPFTILAAHIAGMGRPKVNLAIAAVGFVVMVGLDLWLIPAAGIEGAAIASTAAYLTMTLLTIAYFLRATGSRPADVLVVRASDIGYALGSLRRVTRRS